MMQIFKNGTLAGALGLAAMAYSTAANAGLPCVSLTTINAAVTENFDTLASTGTGTLAPPWYMFETDTNANTLYTAGTGSANAGDTYSFGAAASSERALGGLLSGSLVPLYGACFTNNTGTTITSLDIGYTGEQWRLGSADANIDRIDFQYSTVATAVNTGVFTDFNALDFSSPTATPANAALDGNAAANRTVIAPQNIPGLSIAAGATFWIRWSDLNVTGSDDGLAVDDFSLTPNGAAPSTDLSIVKTDSPDSVTAGNNLTYTITVTNLSANAAATVAMTDNTPAGTTFVSVTTPAGWSCATQPAPGGTGPVTCTIASLAGAGSAVFTMVVNVPAATASGATISNTATVSTTTTDSDPANNTDTEDTAVQTAADLSLTITDSPDPVTAGTNITYVATVTNAGPSDAQAVIVSIPFPNNTTFVSGTVAGGGTCTTGANISCTFTGPVVPGAPRAATITVAVAGNTPAGTVVTANPTVASTTTDPTPGNNSASTTTTVSSSADISLTLTDSPDPVTAGNNLTYVATVSNAGPSDAAGVTVTMTTPTNTTFVSGSVAGGGSCSGTTTITCTFTGLVLVGTPRAATIMVAVAAATPSGTVISATANAATTSTDPVPGNNSATTTTTVNASANLALTLTPSATEVTLGQPVTFTAVSTNTGPSDAQNVVVSITLSPDFRFSSFTASAGAVCTTPQVGLSGVISCTWAGPTAPNATRTLAVTASSNSPGTSSIQASTSSATTDPVTTNNTVSQAIVVGASFEPIPALDRYGLILLGLLFGLLGMAAVRRQS